MSRLNEVIEFTEFDINKNFLIEPEQRFDALKERLFDVINIYKPEVIVKTGIGYGNILHEIEKAYDSYIVVVEPSLDLINNFRKKYKDTEIKFINGDFHEFPVDYYAADLLVCIDYLDFLDSGKCLDEFKIALQFDGIFFLAGVVLNEKDIEGVYDDFIKKVFPLHNDYYLPSDLKTVLELKGYSLVKGMLLKFDKSLNEMIDHLKAIFKDISIEEAKEYIESHKNEFNDLLKMNEDLDIQEPYYVGVFLRLKPKEENI